VIQMPHMTGNPWLPPWLGVAAVAVFAVMVAIHLGHTYSAPGRVAVWHLAHVLMALGMIVMFLPTGGMVVPAGVGEVVFAAAALATGGFRIVTLVRGSPVGWLWLILGIDLAAMVYMFALPTTPLEWLTVALVAWFALQAMGWATGRLCLLAAESGLSRSPETTSIRVPATVPATGSAESGPVDLRAAADSGGSTDSADTTAAGKAAHAQLDSGTIRLTLTVMSVAMAYMLLAMQFGMVDMPGMGGMPGL
jgi:hypothetical protein